VGDLFNNGDLDVGISNIDSRPTLLKNVGGSNVGTLANSEVDRRSRKENSAWWCGLDCVSQCGWFSAAGRSRLGTGRSVTERPENSFWAGNIESDREAGGSVVQRWQRKPHSAHRRCILSRRAGKGHSKGQNTLRTEL